MKIAFHTNQLCLQGTEVALYDYADFCEKLWGFESLIISRNNKITERGGAGKNQPLAIEKFEKRFKVILYKDKSEIEKILIDNNIDLLYCIKKGINDGIFSSTVKTAIHVVFKYYDPHGDRYAYVSKWLSNEVTSGKLPYVPHMINMPKVDGNLRAELGIPPDAIVFGRYGGMSNFDIDFVFELILDYAVKNKHIYFIFMNTDNFTLNKFFRSGIGKRLKKYRQLKSPLKNIIFLKGTHSMEYKSRFINTCTSMLHARLRGETFGIAVGEFSVNNIPVITFGGKGVDGFESNHLDILKDKCLIYNNSQDLLEIFNNIKEGEYLEKGNWDAYSKEYSPESVMLKFKEVFID